MLLNIENLYIAFKEQELQKDIINGLGLEIKEGEIFALVGESGCGKTTTALAIANLLPRSITKISGKILFERIDLLGLSIEQLNSIRGSKITYIFQQPATSLNPVLTIKDQLVETICLHKNISKEKAYQDALVSLREVGIENAQERIDCYSHQLSGGQKQRVMIAMALSSNPKLLIADEPTTALDVTIQAQILFLLKNLNKKFGLSILLITHDLNIVRKIADTIGIMYKGVILEKGSSDQIFNSPKHPYTKALLYCAPKIGESKKRLPTIKDYFDEN